VSLDLALKVHDWDNVATIFAGRDILDGMEIVVRDKKGNDETVTVAGDVPYGHKIALCDLPPGAAVIKYGEEIGAASKPIRRGEYVHVHNMDSMRGRGDLSGEAAG
jgi:altronate dehydratase small subunit